MKPHQYSISGASFLSTFAANARSPALSGLSVLCKTPRVQTHLSCFPPIALLDHCPRSRCGNNRLSEWYPQWVSSKHILYPYLVTLTHRPHNTHTLSAAAIFATATSSISARFPISSSYSFVLSLHPCIRCFARNTPYLFGARRL